MLMRETKGVGCVTYKHSGNSGDIIAALAGIRQVWKTTGMKGVLYLRLNVPAFYYHGAGQHPVQDGSGRQVMLSQKMYDMLRPLIIAQDYINDVRVWDGEPVHVDLDKIRGEGNVGMPNTQIQHWYGFLFPDMMCDIAEKWLEVGIVDPNDSVIVARTSRYTSEFIDFHFLRDVPNVKFAGLESEWREFEQRWGVGSELLVVSDFYRLAMRLVAAKFVICNQSMVYNICEALKVPRILEICPWAANCTPVGEKAVSYMHQGGLEYWVSKFLEDGE